MNFKQFLLENESVIGKQIWITDYRRGKSGGYVRHVPPTLVEVTCNSELPKINVFIIQIIILEKLRMEK